MTLLANAAIVNGCGQTFVKVAQQMAGSAGAESVGVERLAAADTGFVARLGRTPDAALTGDANPRESRCE